MFQQNLSKYGPVENHSKWVYTLHPLWSGGGFFSLHMSLKIDRIQNRYNKKKIVT